MKTAYIEAFIEIDGIDQKLEITRYSGSEGISELFRFDLSILAESALSPDDLVATEAKLRFERDGTVVRTIVGVLAQVVDMLTSDAEQYAYRVLLVPALWRSQLVQLIDIYMDMDIAGLVTHKLDLLALAQGDDYQLRLLKDYPTREFVVQYQETDFLFLSRQLEHYGIHFAFEHLDGDEVLIIGDGDHAFSEIGDEDGQMTFVRSGELPGIFELKHQFGVIPANYIQRDYNYRQHGADVTANVAVAGPGRLGAIYEYGGHFKTEAEGHDIAQVRAEERGCRQRVLEGKSTLPEMRAGGKTTLTNHPRGNKELLITRVEHHGQQGFHAADGAAAYHNRFDAIEQGVPFRPLRKTAKPRISGFLTGIIESETDSEYADVDDEGRYRVRFMFDTAPPGEKQASRPIRMMQPHAGPGYGMHFPLRGGIEVLISFVGGDPDRPIIVGTAPNPRTPSPVAAKNRERNIIRTGGANEFDIDDTEDEQRIKISTPRSSSLLQLGAPNAPEDGALLQSATSVTNTAGASVNQAAPFASSWTLWSSLWGNHVTAVAGKVMCIDIIKYSIDTVSASLKQVSSYMAIPLAVASTVEHFKQQEADNKKKEVENSEKRLKTKTEALKTAGTTLQAKDTALDTALTGVNVSNLTAAEQTDINTKKTAYAAAQTTLANEQQALAQLQAQRAAAEAAGDYDTVAALDELITAKETAVTTAETAVDTSLTAVDTALHARQKLADDTRTANEAEIETLQAQLDALQPTDPGYATLQAQIATKNQEMTEADALAAQLDLTTYDAAKDEYDTASSDYDTKRTAYDSEKTTLATKKTELATKEKAVKDYQDKWKPTSETKGYLDKVIIPAWSTITGVPYSWLTTILATGMQGYAASCTTVMMDETLEQLDGAAAKVFQIGKSGWGGYGRNAPKDVLLGPDRVNAGWGALTRTEWVVDDRANPATDMGETDYFRFYLHGGGGAGLMGSFKKPWQAAFAGVMVTLFGPIAGAFVFQFLKKSAAFNESRNIQGSEQKAILFGKESAYIYGQEYATVSSGRRLLMTANDHAVVHSRGNAELVGIESAYLASGKQIDILSRGAIDMQVTDRSEGGDYAHDSFGDEPALAQLVMTTNPVQPAIPPAVAIGPAQAFVPAVAGSMAGQVILQTRDNAGAPATVSRLFMNGQEATLTTDSSADFADAKLRLECSQQGTLKSYLELSETNNTQVAKLMGGTFGVEADGGAAAFAALKSNQLEVKVTDDVLGVGAPGANPHLKITRGGDTELRGDGELKLGGPTKISLISGTIEFGGAAINQVNLQVKDSVNPGVAQLRQAISKAQADASKAKQDATQALDDADEDFAVLSNCVEALYKELKKKANKRKKKKK